MMIGITTFSFKNEKVNEFLAPIDAMQNLCGIDYPDYPYVYYTIQLIFPDPENIPTKDEIDRYMSSYPMFSRGRQMQIFPGLILHNTPVCVK
jgi:hypothetical protein